MRLRSLHYFGMDGNIARSFTCRPRPHPPWPWNFSIMGMRPSRYAAMDQMPIKLATYVTKIPVIDVIVDVQMIP
jgi:hypothetical protein